jgi:transcription initiation factor IIF auxiliary subunit
MRLNKDSAKFVDKVQWRLHKTFRDPLVECDEAPFSIMRVGWGTFTIHFKIYLKEDAPTDTKVLEGSHYLVFDGENEVVATTEVPIPKKDNGSKDNNDEKGKEKDEKKDTDAKDK